MTPIDPAYLRPWPASSAGTSYLNPVFTLLTATLFLGERMTPLSAVGCAAILDGVIWVGSGKTD